MFSADIDWPDDQEISDQAKDFVHKLLTMEQSERLGANGAGELMQHPWFEGIDWDTLMSQKSLFIPKCDDITDTSYFNGTSPTSSRSLVLCL